jgi:TRAP-type C4-dicarboxylate transport system substrate-binding protein
VFQACRPLFQQAYQGLGERGGDVQAAVERAAQVLLEAHEAGSSAALKEKGIVFAYVDDALESASPAQKQLMRMGPKNEAKIQAKLREVLRALGASASPSAR